MPGSDAELYFKLTCSESSQCIPQLQAGQHQSSRTPCTPLTCPRSPHHVPTQPLQLLHPPAGIFSGLGYKVHLVIRGEQPLRGFDEELRQLVGTNLGKRGVDVHLKTSPTK